MAKFPTKPIETPRGKLEWVTITGDGKENLSGKLQYVANLVIETPEDTAAVEAQIEAFWNENKPAKFTGKPKSIGIYPHTEYTGEKDENGKPITVDSGKKYLAFKTGTTYSDGKPKVIEVLNSKNNKVVLGATKIGNGSIGRISGQMGIYTTEDKRGNILSAGVTLYLDAIKLLKLVEYSAGPSFSSDDSEYEAVGEEYIGEEASASETGEAQRPRL